MGAQVCCCCCCVMYCCVVYCCVGDAILDSQFKSQTSKLVMLLKMLDYAQVCCCCVMLCCVLLCCVLLCWRCDSRQPVQEPDVEISDAIKDARLRTGMLLLLLCCVVVYCCVGDAILDSQFK